MKLHLPRLLFISLLVSFLATPAYTSEAIDNYDIVDLWTPDMLSDYANNSAEDYYAFHLYDDATYTPNFIQDWNDSTPLVSGGHLIFTTAEGYNPVTLTFSNGLSQTFYDVTNLTFDTLNHLEFNNTGCNYYYNESSICGGAINCDTISITHVDDGVEDTVDVLFQDNIIGYQGGAIYCREISIMYNGNVEFTGNKTVRHGDICGGAIYGETINLSNNKSVSFNGNNANCEHAAWSADGGAIRGTYVILNNNNSVHFSGNEAMTDSTWLGCGGAIVSDSTTLLGNVKVEFKANTCTFGAQSSYEMLSNCGAGAICTETLTMSNNGSVTFSENSASGKEKTNGGAIRTGSLSIQNNDFVLFDKNTLNRQGTYCLRGIYAGGEGYLISFSAAADKSIEFRDSMYIASGSTVNLNKDYSYQNEDGVTVTVKQKGDIIFTGATTEDDLYIMKGNVAGTAEEILASRTTEVYAMTNLYGGRLRVEDGAVYKGCGITLHEGSAATLLVKNATVNQSGYDISLAAGTKLDMQGNSSVIAANLTLAVGSELRVELTSEHLTSSAITLSGTVQANALTITLNMADDAKEGAYRLISGGSLYNSSLWTAENITVIGSGAAKDAGFSDLFWQDGVLYYNLGYDLGGTLPLHWSNNAGNSEWNSTAKNWQAERTFADGKSVLFTDEGCGTVQLVGGLAPVSMTVNNNAGCDYTFIEADGGGKLVGDIELVKQGEGGITLATANEFSGATRLEGGNLNVHHSTALGATAEGLALLTAAAGTTLRVANGSQLVLAGQGNSLGGDVEVTEDSSLEMKASGYAATSSTVNGTLFFTDTEGTTGELAGSGTLHVTNSRVSVASHSEFSGNLIVSGSNASLSMAEVYSTGGRILLQGGRLELPTSKDLILQNGGMLCMAQKNEKSAELAARNVNVHTGATLSVQDELCGADSATAELAAFINSTPGGSMEVSRLTLTYGSTLLMDGAHLNLNGGSLTLAVPISASDKIFMELAMDGMMQSDSRVLLFSQVDSVTFVYDGNTVNAGNGVYSYLAADYFCSSWLNENTLLVYDSNQSVVYLQGMELIPEPATTTLSLLALCALASRRRRR